MSCSPGPSCWFLWCQLNPLTLPSPSCPVWCSRCILHFSASTLLFRRSSLQLWLISVLLPWAWELAVCTFWKDFSCSSVIHFITGGADGFQTRVSGSDVCSHLWCLLLAAYIWMCRRHLKTDLTSLFPDVLPQLFYVTFFCCFMLKWHPCQLFLKSETQELFFLLHICLTLSSNISVVLWNLSFLYSRFICSLSVSTPKSKPPPFLYTSAS